MQNPEPDLPLGEQLYYALTQVDIQRVHTTLTIDDFDCIKQDTRYIFYNNGPAISVLPLPPLKRKMQRNMKVEDDKRRNLIFIPSSSCTDLLVNASIRILDAAQRELPPRQTNGFNQIRDILQPTLKNVFKYEPEQADIESACAQINNIRKERDFWTKDFIDVFILADILFQYKNGLYQPLISLAEPLQSRSYTIVHLSIERVREYLQDKKARLTFNSFGKFTFSFEPEIERGISNHVRIYAPDGLIINDVEFDIGEPEGEPHITPECSCKELQQYLDENKKDYFDKKCFYVQLGPEKSKTLYPCTKHFNVAFGRMGLLSTLLWLWWLTVLSPAIFGVVYLVHMLPSKIAEIIVSDTFVLALLGLSATFLVAVGIYAIDKKIVKSFITTHIILIYGVLVIEIVFMILLSLLC